MYEATPWFGGVADAPDETETAEELRELFKRLGIVEEVSRYFLYEATDALVRIDNCKLSINAILLNMLPDFYLSGTQLQKLLQVFEDQKLEKERLWLTVPEEILKTCSKTNLEIIRRYPRNGFVLMVDGYHPDELLPETLLEYGIKHVRIAPELYMQQDTANRIRILEKQGFTVVGGNADSPETLAWLCACGVCCSSGTMTGIPVNEDELILDSLAREQK
jgi:EAL domain-containing protein (putative c-di-GMP-specific phosphodiesterase class I)